MPFSNTGQKGSRLQAGDILRYLVNKNTAMESLRCNTSAHNILCHAVTNADKHGGASEQNNVTVETLAEHFRIDGKVVSWMPLASFTSAHSHAQAGIA